MFSKFIYKVYLVFSPRTAPSIITIAGKALLGWSLIQISAFVKTLSPDKYPNEDTQLFAQLVETKMDFLQSFTFTQFLDKSGEVLMIDAALDLSKILIMFGEDAHQRLKLHYDRKKFQNKLSEINDALKQKQSGNKKSARKLKTNLDELKLERDKIERWLKSSEKLTKTELIASELGSQTRNFNYVYTTYLVEFLASLYIMASLVEPLHLFLNRIWFSPEQYTNTINAMISEVKARQEFPSFATPFTIFLNYVFSPKIAIAIAILQIILNQIDFSKHRKARKVLGNIPIIGLLNSLGFKFNSITAIYELSKYAAGSVDFFQTTLEALKNPDSAMNQEYLFPLRNSLYEQALKLGYDKDIAKKIAHKESSDHIHKYLNDLTKFKDQKWRLVSIARYINIYGNFKFYKNFLHVVDNIIDLIEQTSQKSTEILASEKIVPQNQVSNKLSNQRIDTFGQSIQKLSAEFSLQKSRTQPDISSAFSSIKAVSFQAQNVVFPEEPVRKEPKKKTRRIKPETELETETQAQDQAQIQTQTQTQTENDLLSEAEAESASKLKRKTEILLFYPDCNKILLRSILKRTEKSLNRTISEHEILTLARDLRLNCRRTDSGYLIQVYKEFHASFHFSHGRDRAGSVSSAFISELSNAFKAIGLSIEDLDEIDQELGNLNCCKADVLNMLAYILTERPKSSGRKFS